MGPETLTAAMIFPEGESTGAETEATPGSRSATDCAHPRRRTCCSDSIVNVASLSRRGRFSGSSQANSTCAADPAVMDSCAPRGTVSRRPEGRSTVAEQIRKSP